MRYCIENRGRLVRSRSAALGGVIGLLFGCVSGARAQDRVVIQGILDGELWKSDSGSLLLTRNNGHAASVGRLELLTAAELFGGLQFLAQSQLQTGDGRAPREVAQGTQISLEQAVLRYDRFPKLVMNVGKLLSPVGTFGDRRLSTTNPLIGSPDSYPVSYPWGAELSGAASLLDYRAALVSLAATNPKYVPEPGAAPHVVLGAGITPHPALRLGASYTQGPYLSGAISDSLAAGAHWRDYDQRLLALDARFSLDYLEVNAELARSSYDVPGQTQPFDGTAYYGELKYTWTARLFTAARLEWNDYPFVRVKPAGGWTARDVSFYNLEIGVGYRLTRETLAKVSVQRDRWDTRPSGYAVAFQLSRQFDVMSWLDR
jgi:hypothetical protein